MSKKKSPTKPKAAKTVKVSKPASKPAKVEREQRNGITRPGTDTVCALVWNALDQMAAGKVEYTLPALRELVDDARGKRPAADDTLKTQRSRWLKFNGSK